MSNLLHPLPRKDEGRVERDTSTIPGVHSPIHNHMLHHSHDCLRINVSAHLLADPLEHKNTLDALVDQYTNEENHTSDFFEVVCSHLLNVSEEKAMEEKARGAV